MGLDGTLRRRVDSHEGPGGRISRGNSFDSGDATGAMSLLVIAGRSQEILSIDGAHRYITLMYVQNRNTHKPRKKKKYEYVR